MHVEHPVVACEIKVIVIPDHIVFVVLYIVADIDLKGKLVKKFPHKAVYFIRSILLYPVTGGLNELESDQL